MKPQATGTGLKDQDIDGRLGFRLRGREQPGGGRMLDELDGQIRAIDGLAGTSSVSGEFIRWRRQTEEVLKALCGEDSSEVQAFNAIYFTPVFLTCRMGDKAFDEAHRDGLDEARGFLLSIRARITPRG